jgi:hypothetical protein
LTISAPGSEPDVDVWDNNDTLDGYKSGRRLSDLAFGVPNGGLLAVISYVGAGITAVAALALWIAAGKTSAPKTSALGTSPSWPLRF